MRGTLLGAAVGDALGAPVDGLDLDAVRREHGAEGLTDLAPAHGRRGAVTHLTQLTLFSVDGLIRAQVRRDTGAWHPPTDLHRAYLRWAATQRDWGPDLRREEDGWLAREEWLYARRAAPRALLLGLGDATMGTPQARRTPVSAVPRPPRARRRSGCWSAGSRNWSRSSPWSARRRPTATPAAI